MFTGKYIRLSELDPDNLEKLRTLRNDPNIFKNFYQHKLITKEDHQKWFSKINNNTHYIYFEIHSIETKVLIGQCALININWIDRTSDFGIYIDSEFIGKGYGKDSLSVLINYAFNNLNLNRIYSSVFNFNNKAIELYKKLAFKIEGTLRNHHFDNGRYIDVIMIGLLKEDWVHSNLLS